MEKLKTALLNSPTKSQWEQIDVFPRHGIDITLSSLHSANSCGIGEFLDLLPVIDWCHEIPFNIIQLLPLNDSGNDPSPYNALSSCALNPLYLSLHALPFLDELPEMKKKLAEMHKLTQSQRINFNDVQSHKLKWLFDYFEKIAPNLSKNQGLIDFIKTNPWVKPYALFKVFKEMLKESHWMSWPAEMCHLTAQELEKQIDHYWPKASFFITLQYLCFEQLKQVKKYAHEKGILMKGDIPILISPDSADVWYHSEFFDLNLAAGAPPDPYNQEGQYWGFPLYHWEVKKKTQYSWWIQRLACASQIYDLYRIDHAVGFFRIWGIPLGGKPTEGSFYPADEALWIPEGKERLEMMLKASTLMPIAEDLGTVPDAVRTCLAELGICGTKVMRWERYWKKDESFIPLQDYPVLSMTCISTHDSETLTLWWKNSPEEAQVYAEAKGWSYAPYLTFSQRMQILWESHHTASLFHINLLQEYFALFPELVWENPEDERINVPGTMTDTNWTYRFRPSIEEFTSHAPLKEAIKKILLYPTPETF